MTRLAGRSLEACSCACLLFLCLAFSGCSEAPQLGTTATVQVKEANSQDQLACGTAIQGAAPFLRSGAVLLLGELHGTREAPAFVGKLACQATSADVSVRVGLEVDPGLQPFVDAFLWSDGLAQDRQQLTEGPFWSGRDGRSSLAMVALLDEVRRLKLLEMDVEAYLFDDPGNLSEARDVAMAQNILAHIKQGYPSVTSFDFSYSGGTAWVSTAQGIGISKIGVADHGASPFIELFSENLQTDYTGHYYVGAISASSPAQLGDGG
ncbi:MAG: hypothetical protein ACI9F9_002950 [Candidatus Paceibacteria bacterium]|jgi:hypothetical protein